jgi:putative lipoic acid-binding regulatory protein
MNGSQEWPQRVPVKVIGRAGELQADMIAATIRERLGPQGPETGSSGSNCKGAYISFTFWVILPDAGAEAPLREAIAKLPGYVMQL